MQQLNWDNLRYVLMVANKGSIAAAARELGVNRTTVLRRIDGFQQSLNCRLFERGEAGYALTPEAEKIVDAARDVENVLFDMSRRIAGRELRLEGELRVTTTDSFMLSLLAPWFASFCNRYPHIVVDVLVTNTVLDLHRRDADVAIRPTREADPGLVGRRLGNVEFAIYAVPALCDEMANRDPFEGRWIGFVDSLGASPIGRWLARSVDASRVGMRCDTFVSVRAAAEEGVGLALLPCFLGDHSRQLQRVAGIPSEMTTGLWLLTHPDLARSARVNAFMEHFANVVPADE